MVKANAYGHGLDVARMRLSPTADGLALLDFGRRRRAACRGWSRPILMLEGAFDPTDYRVARALA